MKVTLKIFLDPSQISPSFSVNREISIMVLLCTGVIVILIATCKLTLCTQGKNILLELPSINEALYKYPEVAQETNGPADHVDGLVIKQHSTLCSVR